MVKRIATLILGISYLFVGNALAYADTKPYFKVFGGDVFAGGWFNSAATSCNPADTTSYQAPTFNPNQNLNEGGILAFANGRTGASSDFGAYFTEDLRQVFNQTRSMIKSSNSLASLPYKLDMVLLTPDYYSGGGRNLLELGFKKTMDHHGFEAWKRSSPR